MSVERVGGVPCESEGGPTLTPSGVWASGELGAVCAALCVGALARYTVYKA